MPQYFQNTMARKQKSKSNSFRPKRRVKKSGKLSKFNRVMKRLKQMNSNQQRQALTMANDAFIRQLSNQVKKLRHINLNAPLRTRVQSQKKKLQKLVLPKTSIRTKCKKLTQRGVFLPLLVPPLRDVGAMARNIIAGSKRRS